GGSLALSCCLVACSSSDRSQGTAGSGMDGARCPRAASRRAAPEGTRRVPRPTRARGGVVDALADATAAVDAREDGAAGNDGADVRVADGKRRTLERPGYARSGQRQPERRREQT